MCELEILTDLATIAGVIIAGMALNTWKTQLKGNKSHDIAWKYLEATLHLREAINSGVRNPMIAPGEFQQASEEYYGKDKIDVAKQQNPQAELLAVYAIRWREISEAREKLRTAKISAEVWWGNQIVGLDQPLNDMIGVLYVHVKRLTNPERGMIPDHDTLYYLPNIDTDFDKKLNEAVRKIDRWMRPHIQYERNEHTDND